MPLFIQDDFTGGIAEGSLKGYKGAFQDAIGIDYRSDPDWLRINPPLEKISSTTITGKPIWGVTSDSNKWIYDDDGKIYKITSADAVSLAKTVTGGAGEGIEFFNGEIWYMGGQTIGKMSDPDGTPSYEDNYFESPRWEVDQWTDVAGNTYTLPTAISETAANKKDFTVGAGVYIWTGIAVELMARGTGNWTLTVHDSSNNVLTSQTIANSSLSTSSDSMTWFMFDEPIQVTPGTTYHFHLTSTVADGTVKTLTASDMSTINYAGLRDDYGQDIDQENALSATDRNGLPQPTKTYSPQAVITETSTHKTYFTPEKALLSAISLYVHARTLGTFTLEVHDLNNEVIVSENFAVGDIRERGWTKFSFDPVELIPGVEYHFHFLESTGAARLFTETSQDASDLYFRTHFMPLRDETYHMAKRFLNLLCIGNGNYLATIDDSEVFEPEFLQFPKGEKVRCLETIGDYLAISTWRGDDIAAHGTSRVYFWDGTSPTFNAFIDIDGQVNAMINDSNKLAIIHGTQVNISYYTGAVTKVRKLKNVGTNVTAEVLPGAVAIYEGVLHFGVSNTSSTAIDACVYSYGKKDKDYPSSLNKEYPISTGNKGTTVDVSMLLAIGTGKFYVGWEDTTAGAQGVDKINLSNKQQSVYVHLMRFNDNDPNRQKEFLTASLRFDEPFYDEAPTPDEYEKITLQYRIDGETTWTTLGTVDPLNNTDDRGIRYKSFSQQANMDDPKFFEIEWKIIMEANTDTSNVDKIIFAMEYERLPEFQIGTVGEE